MSLCTSAHTIRDELHPDVVRDRLGLPGGEVEELDQREDRCFALPGGMWPPGL